MYPGVTPRKSGPRVGLPPRKTNPRVGFPPRKSYSGVSFPGKILLRLCSCRAGPRGLPPPFSGIWTSGPRVGLPPRKTNPRVGFSPPSSDNVENYRVTLRQRLSFLDAYDIKTVGDLDAFCNVFAHILLACANETIPQSGYKPYKRPDWTRDEEAQKGKTPYMVDGAAATRHAPRIVS